MLKRFNVYNRCKVTTMQKCGIIRYTNYAFSTAVLDLPHIIPAVLHSPSPVPTTKCYPHENTATSRSDLPLLVDVSGPRLALCFIPKLPIPVYVHTTNRSTPQSIPVTCSDPLPHIDSFACTAFKIFAFLSTPPPPLRSDSLTLIYPLFSSAATCRQFWSWTAIVFYPYHSVPL